MIARDAIDLLYDEMARRPVLQTLAAGRAPVRSPMRTDAPVMVIEECPYENEPSFEARLDPIDALGVLCQMLTEARIRWDFTYLTYAVPWCPPGRLPYPAEILACSDRLRGEVDIVAPAVVIACGPVSWQALMGREAAPFAERRGKWTLMALAGGGHADVLAIHPPSSILAIRPGVRETRRAEIASALSTILEGERER